MSQDAKDYLTSLPPELLLKVGGYLDISNKLKLRLVLPRNLEGVVADLLKDIRTNLHLDFSKISLENFEGICETPFFADHVTCLVFVPGTHRKNIEAEVQTIESYRKTPPVAKLDRRESTRSFKIFKELENDYSSDISGYRDSAGASKRTQRKLEEVHHLLCRGLRSLPRLQTLCVMDRPDREGLNVGTLFLSDQITEERVSVGHHTVLGDEAGRAAMGFCRSGGAGLEILLQAIAAVERNVKAMIFGTAMDQLWDGLDSYAFKLDYHTFDWVFRNLTRLTVAFYDNWSNEPDECGKDWTMMIKTANALEYLKIIPDQGECEGYPDEFLDGSKVIYHFLDLGHFSKLKCLHIEGDHQRINVVQAQKLLDFWARHKDTLQEIVLHDVAPSWTLSLQDVSAVRRILDEGRAQSHSLQSFRLTLNSAPERDRAIREKLDELAAELGVSQSSDGWEFGDYVMR